MDNRPILTDNALHLLKTRYLLKNNSGKIIETPRGMFERVAKCVSYPELHYKNETAREHWYNVMLNAMLDLCVVPASPYLFNARDPEVEKSGGLFSCFVMPIADSIDSIYKCLGECAKVYQAGGGIGIDFSVLRERNAIVETSKGLASGPMSFLNVFHYSSCEMTQGGVRRAASIAFMDMDHPEIEDFITTKSQDLPEINRLTRIVLNSTDKALKRFAELKMSRLQRLTSFNLSVKMTDKFMEAVQQNADWKLWSRKTGKPIKTVKARKLFNLVCEYAWKSGDPGLCFIDTVNRDNKLPHLGRIEASNPCNSIDNMVLTEYGYLRIRDFLENKNIKLYYNGKLYSHTGFVKSGENRQLIEIKLNNGQKIKLTPNHKLIRSDGTEVSVEHLKHGDVLEQHLFNIHKDFDIDNVDEYEKGILSGWLVGDGTTFRRPQKLKHNAQHRKNRKVDDKFVSASIAIGENEFDCKDYILSLLNRHCCANVSWSRCKNKQCYTAYVNNKYVDFFGCKYKSDFTLLGKSKSFKIGFLRGIFSTDGSVREKQAAIELYFSKNHRIYEEIQLVLCEFGMPSSITTHNKKKSYISSDGITRNNATCLKLCVYRWDLFTHIGFLNASKQKKMLCLREKRKIIPKLKVTGIKVCECEDVYNTTVINKSRYVISGVGSRNCGELYMLPYHACNLVALNLNKFDLSNNLDQVFQFARVAARMAENAIDVSSYPLPQIEEAVKDTRGIGIGVMGFADQLIKLGIPYDTDEARHLISEVFRVLRDGAIHESKILAEERGVPNNWKHSVWAKEDIKVRNLWHTTSQPTGSVSIIAGASQSLEPLWNVYCERRTHDGDTLTELHSGFKATLEYCNIDVDKTVEELKKVGSIQRINFIPDDIKRLFRCAHDISPEDHVKMQAAAQQYVDSGISKTINLPPTASQADIAKVYRMAYDLGCKGTTVFREGSKQGVLSVVSAEDKYNEELRKWLVTKFCREGLTAREISDILGVSEQCVFAKLKRYGIRKEEHETAIEASRKRLNGPLRDIIIANILVGHSKVQTVDHQSSYRQVTAHLVYAHSVRKKFLDRGIPCSEIMSIATDKTYYYFDTCFLEDIYDLPIDYDSVLTIKTKEELHEFLTPYFVRHLFLVGGIKTGHGGVKFLSNSRNLGVLKKFMELLRCKLQIEINIREDNVYIPKHSMEDFYNFLESGESINTTTNEGLVCPECGGELIISEKCRTCSACGWGACSI